MANIQMTQLQPTKPAKYHANTISAVLLMFMLMSQNSTANSEQVRIAFSNTEQLEVFALNADSKGQWCADNINVTLKSGNPDIDYSVPAVDRMIAKVGAAVVEKTCPAARQVTIYREDTNIQLGIATKNSQWVIKRNATNTQTTTENHNTSLAEEPDNADSPKLLSCYWSWQCYRSVIDDYGRSAGNAISVIGRVLGILLVGVAVLFSPVKDGRFKTGYKGNATEDASFSFLGAALVVFLAGEALGYIAKNYLFIIMSVCISVAFLWALSALGKRQEAHSTPNNDNTLDLAKDTETNSPEECDQEKGFNFNEFRILKEVFVDNLKQAGCKDVVALPGFDNVAHFSMQGFEDHNKRQKLVDQICISLGGQNQDRTRLIQEYYFDIPTSKKNRIHPVTIWFGANRKVNGEEEPRALVSFNRDDYDPAKVKSAATDRFLKAKTSLDRIVVKTESGFMMASVTSKQRDFTPQEALLDNGTPISLANHLWMRSERIEHRPHPIPAEELHTFIDTQVFAMLKEEKAEKLRADQAC